jgi:hypothetical protein
MSYTFDGVNKLIILSSGTVTIDLADLYSRYKDWLRTSENSKYPLFFETVGGENIDPVEGTIVPLYLFLANGAKIRPQEADHTLNVKNGTLIGYNGGDPFVGTIGDFVVRIKYSQPVQAQGIVLSGNSSVVDPAVIAAAVKDLIQPYLDKMDATVSSRMPSGALVDANVKQMNSHPVIGDGTSANKWRGSSV